MFKKILIANRGEIAVRVIRACHELSVEAVAVFSEADRAARHLHLADQAWLLEGPPGKAYLDIAQILSIAKRAGAEAIHPGYGFLAENANFARATESAGLAFVGPPADVIHKMGSKVESRRLMKAAGVPVVPGSTDPVSDPGEIKRLCLEFGFPVAIKASAGGGGRGLRLVHKEQDVEQAFQGAQREGSSYFGNAEVYLEKYLDRPRHIEVQILADHHGNVVHLGERDCSAQRRHQKLLEETPAPGLPLELRQKILEAAVLAARSIGYTSAGTVEGLVAGDKYYFLEMNTRVQVEHPITEMVTGIDIVKEQILVASGEPLSFTQDEVAPRGHAIECRINAEDPARNFLPSPGTVTGYSEPSRPWVRVDSACYPGYQVLPLYDSLLAKLVVWGRTRQECIARTRLALNEFKIEGVATTIPFHLALLEDSEFQEGRVHTGYVESQMKARLKSSVAPAAPKNGELTQPPPVQRAPGRTFEVEVDNRHFRVQVAELKAVAPENPPDVAAAPAGAVLQSGRSGSGTARQSRGSRSLPAASRPPDGGSAGDVRAAMHSLVKQVLVGEGDSVSRGQRLLVLEAMKMESDIVAQGDARIKALKVKVGDTVDADQTLLVLETN